MKKIIYSSITKFIALLVLLACTFQTVNLVSDCLIKYFGNEKEIYGFEDRFEDSTYMSVYLNDAMHSTFNAFVVYNCDNTKQKTLDELITEYLGNVSEYAEYKIIINDMVFESEKDITKEEILGRHFNSFFYKHPDGELEFSTTGNLSTAYYWADMQYLENLNIEIYCSLDEDFVKECEEIWTEQRNLIYNTFSQSLSLVLVFLVMLIYLICTCGKSADGEYKSMWIDKIPVELHLGFMVLFVGLGLGVPLILFDEYFSSHLPQYFIDMPVPAVSTLAVLLVVTSILSLVRKIKCGAFLSTSIVFIVFKWAFKLAKRISMWAFGVFKRGFKSSTKAVKFIFSAFARKTSLILLSVFLVYSVLITLLTVGIIAESFNALYILVFLFLVAVGCVFVAVRARDFEMISRGAYEIRKGNLFYIIDEPKSDDMKQMASNINEIAKGLDESVSAKMRAERLKTDLVTNVSHDLKTPLTSIINYTQLLSELDNLPEEAQDYIRIIAKKSDRLKTLTQDLFDISKVQSGNESINLEKLDVSLLINQSLGENDKEIDESGITFVTNIERELYILADGRKMSRVISNLINNILKYSMKGTRAFVETRCHDSKAVIEFKNISAYPMDFDSQEISLRFVRGDKSRSEEGSGLGLAIAKSYTEACGGTFEIILDGDMFKVLISFDLSE